MPSWFWGDLRLVGEALLGALMFFTYTTITGTAGFCLLRSIHFLSVRQWKLACVRGLYGLAVGISLTAAVILFIRTTPGLMDRLGLASLAIPYILGFFGRFVIPGGGE